MAFVWVPCCAGFQAFQWEIVNRQILFCLQAPQIDISSSYERFILPTPFLFEASHWEADVPMEASGNSWGCGASCWMRENIGGISKEAGALPGKCQPLSKLVLENQSDWGTERSALPSSGDF